MPKIKNLAKAKIFAKENIFAYDDISYSGFCELTLRTGEGSIRGKVYGEDKIKQGKEHKAYMLVKSPSLDEHPSLQTYRQENESYSTSVDEIFKSLLRLKNSEKNRKTVDFSEESRYDVWNPMIKLIRETKDEEIKEEAEMLLRNYNTASGMRSKPALENFLSKHGY